MASDNMIHIFRINKGDKARKQCMLKRLFESAKI